MYHYDPYFDLWTRLFRTTRLMRDVTARTLRRYQLSPQTAGFLLHVLHLNNNAMPIELARLMKRKPQSVTAMEKSLIKKGMLVKTRDGNKKNIFRLSLTEKGETALQKAVNIKAHMEIISALSEEERELLKECLKKLERKTTKLIRNSQR